ncbi:CHAT domain-containing protein [Amycolatopsis sp. NPDC051045]|uniref:CHAT domain-containing protein n=1 Tax=Amycolatopsis sp. NPDC051045 TaxID=3156922 RepID=UPI00342A1425
MDDEQLITWNREAIAATPRVSPSRVIYMSNLGLRRVHQYEEIGNIAFLREAITVLQEAMDIAAPRHSFRHLAAANLARALAMASDHDGGSPTELDRAVATMRDLLPTPEHTVGFVFFELGKLLEQRYRQRGDRTDLDEARSCWNRVMRSNEALREQRMDAASTWGRVAFEMKDFEGAAEAYELAMRLLSQLTWHGLSWNARQKHLTDWSDIASNTATALLAARRPERAVEILEEGRSVIWKQLLRIRTDLSVLDTRAPELAARLRTLREQMDAPGMTVEDDLDSMNHGHLLPQSARERRVQEQLRLTEQWDELVTEVQKIPDLGHLFAPTPFTELSTAASNGPVVIVNVSRLNCHALMVTGPGQVDFIELPDLTLWTAMERTVGFLNVVTRSQQPGRSFIERERDRHEIFDLLEWMWEVICLPIFNRLGLTGANDAPPRLWWCPTNALALLPLHAAGSYPRHLRDDPPEPGASVPDRVVSTYTPTLTALRRLQSRPKPTRSPSVLAVAMPTTRDRAPLPGVTEELTALNEALAGVAEVRHLVGEQATREAVLEVLADYPWVHFACHADQDLMQPEAGSFALADGPLPLRELAEVKLAEPELAYLSACETATGGAQLPDEAIHLAAAMQLIGYRHVVATMWHVADNSAPQVTADVYDQLAGTAGSHAGDPARALHKAVGALRAAHPTDPLRWAPYIHLGP